MQRYVYAQKGVEAANYLSRVMIGSGAEDYDALVWQARLLLAGDTFRSIGELVANGISYLNQFISPPIVDRHGNVLSTQDRGPEAGDIAVARR